MVPLVKRRPLYPYLVTKTSFWFCSALYNKKAVSSSIYIIFYELKVLLMTLKIIN